MTWRRWGILLFILIGIAVSGYLTYTHLANVAPVCAGLGDCAYVQASSYAKIMGVPVALLGLLAYLGMLVMFGAAFWLLDEERAYLAEQIAFGLAFAGFLYSAYLTYVEAFILHAYCIYCVISAISITVVTALAAWDLFAEM